PAALPSISGNGINGTWDIGSISTATVGTQDYIFTATDAGCYTSTTITVTVNDNIEPTFSFVTEYCLNETPATLPLVSGNGITGTWDISAISTVTLGTQDYIFTPTDLGCYIPTTITVTVSTNIEPTFSFDTEYCLNETPATLPLISGNGIAGTWDIGSISTASVGTQDYIFTPTDAGCYIPTTITVTVNDNIEPTFSFVPEYCLNATPATLPLMSDNSITGTWDIGSISTATVGTQDYIFTATDVGCYIPTTVTITVNDNIEPTFSFDTEYCLNETPAALPSISGNGINGIWDIGSISTAAVGTQDYIFTPTDAGCYIPTTVTVTVNPNTTPTFDAVGPYCEGETIPELTTTSNEGINGSWLPEINNMVTTEYTFTPYVGQCATSTATLTITVNPNETPTFDAVAAICAGETLSALPTTSNNGITGTWSPVLDNTQTTEYTFTADAGQCATIASLTITVNPNETPTFDAVAPICAGETLSSLPTTSNNGIDGTWSPALDNTQTTEYTFTPNAGECVTTATLTITIIDYFDATITSDLSHCYSENSVVLTAITAGGTWEGENIVLQGDQHYFMFQNSEPGEYEIIYHFDGLCSDADTVVFNIIENADATIYPTDTLYVDGEPVIIETAYPNGIWSGDYIIENNLFIPANSGIGEFDVIYTIEGICGDSDTSRIIVIAAPIADLLAATVITPDADGLNDTWKIRGIEAYNTISIRIFTRWGDEIFAFDGTGAQYADPLNQWDGKHNNRELPSGGYVYILTVDSNNTYKGTISLIR
ncbi:MAG: gliding motility-associated C-terminal domain-containing protein, partial [Bacteroidales bacterium]|nr:gliding motility-associated C-terminal domain-containing protein [Bacteroidales bacterium]